MLAGWAAGPVWRPLAAASMPASAGIRRSALLFQTAENELRGSLVQLRGVEVRAAEKRAFCVPQLVCRLEAVRRGVSDVLKAGQVVSLTPKECVECCLGAFVVPVVQAVAGVVNDGNGPHV